VSDVPLTRVLIVPASHATIDIRFGQTCQDRIITASSNRNSSFLPGAVGP
jgi:hypothetical protein